MHRRLKEYVEEDKIAATRAKMIIYILYNFHPEQLLEDYTFRTRKGKMIKIKVSDAELSYVEGLIKKHNMTISRLLRNMVYTYFYTLDKRKMNGGLIDVATGTNME